MAAFQAKTSELSRQVASAGRKLSEAENRLRHMQAALLQTPKASQQLFADLKQLDKQLADLQHRLNGDAVRYQLNESTTPSIRSRVGTVAYGHWGTTQMPTQTQQKDIEIAENDFQQFRQDLSTYWQNLESYEAKLETAGAPYTPGRDLD